MVGVKKNLWKVSYEWPKSLAHCQVPECGKVMANNGFAKTAHAKMHERKSEVFREGKRWLLFTGDDPSLEAQGETVVRITDDGKMISRIHKKEVDWNGYSWYPVG